MTGTAVMSKVVLIAQVLMLVNVLSGKPPKKVLSHISSSELTLIKSIFHVHFLNSSDAYKRSGIFPVLQMRKLTP